MAVDLSLAVLCALTITVLAAGVDAAKNHNDNTPLHARRTKLANYNVEHDDDEHYLLVSFEVDDQPYEIILVEHKDFFASDVSFTGHTDDGQVEIDVSHRWFDGHITHVNDSQVRLTLHPDDKFTFVAIMPGDMMVVQINEATGDMEVVHDHEAPNEWSFDHVDELIPEPANVTTRHRRGAQRSPQNTQCPVFLDADARYFKQWGGPCLPTDTSSQCLHRQMQRVTVNMIDILHRADVIYNANFKSAIRLGLAGTAVFTTNNLGIATPPAGQSLVGGNVLSSYGAWLATGASSSSGSYVTKAVRGTGTPTSQQVCLNHLFTSLDCGAVLGTSQIAQPGLLGGICETSLIADNTGRLVALNTGFTTSRGSTTPVDHTVAMLVTTHELGHNFGSSHDCNSNCNLGALPCVPSISNGGAYIMYPSVTADFTQGNVFKFSPCSINSMTMVVQNLGSCLVVPNPCAKGGECCNGNLPRPSTYACRAPDFASPCQDYAYCTGQDPYCPGNKIRADGAYCNTNPTKSGNSGVCRSGSCVPINFQFCYSQVGTGNAPCSLPGNECVRACRSGSLCVGYSSACPSDYFFVDSPSCPYAPAGTPCNTASGQDGVCGGGAACIPCGSPGCASPKTTTPALPKATTKATTKPTTKATTKATTKKAGATTKPTTPSDDGFAFYF
jgi:hypothetical protein